MTLEGWLWSACSVTRSSSMTKLSRLGCCSYYHLSEVYLIDLPPWSSQSVMLVRDACRKLDNYISQENRAKSSRNFRWPKRAEKCTRLLVNALLGNGNDVPND
jgi:hypothetical protein